MFQNWLRQTILSHRKADAKWYVRMCSFLQNIYWISKVIRHISRDPECFYYIHIFPLVYLPVRFHLQWWLHGYSATFYRSNSRHIVRVDRYWKRKTFVFVIIVIHFVYLHQMMKFFLNDCSKSSSILFYTLDIFKLFLQGT